MPMGEVVVVVPDDEGAFARVRRTSRAAGGSTFRLAVAPNPATSGAEARFSIAKPGVVTLRLTDPTGRVVRNVIDGTYMDPGRYAALLDLHDLPSGTWFLEIHANKRVETAQVVVTR